MNLAKAMGRAEEMFSAKDRVGRTPIQVAALWSHTATAGYLASQSEANRKLVQEMQWGGAACEGIPMPWAVLRKGYKPEYV